MSIGYPVDIAEVMEALKRVVLASDSLPYLTSAASVRIVNGMFYAEPWDAYAVYLRPMGSPEEVLAWDGDTGYTKFATHTVSVEAVMKIEDPFSEASVLGRTGATVGIARFVADLCELLENNMLGLTNNQLEPGHPPMIEFGQNAYSALEADTDIWLQSAMGIFRAQTRPFYRTGTFS